MNYYEAQDAFKKMYPDRLVSFEFDGKCIRRVECVYTDGDMHMMNHIEYRHVKVTPKGMESIYVAIDPHREIITASTVKQKIQQDGVYIHPNELDSLKQLREENNPIFDAKVSDLVLHSGLSAQEIQSRIPR